MPAMQWFTLLSSYRVLLTVVGLAVAAFFQALSPAPRPRRQGESGHLVIWSFGHLRESFEICDSAAEMTR
jgi:hypothetical protein